MKRGSALLIVLGMLAFIVISAVAFSAWMRNSRLPSSYLRRTSYARNLVKGALAEAIDIVDAAIGNNPHPGLGDTQRVSCWYPSRNAQGRKDRYDSPLYNVWRNRVYVGTNVNDNILASCDTVSTLSVEGLAFLPPALINEARYYSRHSYGATWHTMNYDSGRFAFCAVDVSDYLDINRIPADMGRSSLPESRFSLAHVFGKADQTAYESNPSEWDTFMKNFVDVDAIKGVTSQTSGQQQGQTGGKLPLTSLADWNLALWNKANGLAQKLSPFCRYFSPAGGMDEIITSRTGTDAEMQRRATFVTDGWFPASSQNASGGTDYDLADDQYQPFSESVLKQNLKPAIRSIIDSSTPACERLRDKISRLGLVLLYDYLDEDNVPVSLAIPEVERTPMVCGIKNTVEGSSIKISNKATLVDGSTEFDEATLEAATCAAADKQTPPTAASDTRTVRYLRKYCVDPTAFTAGIRSGSVKATLAYPFRSSADVRQPDSFKVDGHVEFFFTTGDFKFRTGSVSDLLHLDAGNDSMKEWEGIRDDAVLHIPLQEQNCTFTGVNDENDAVKEVDLMLQQGAARLATDLAARSLVTVTMVDSQTAVQISQDPPVFQWKSGGPQKNAATCEIHPVDATGNRDSRFDDANVLAAFDAGVDLTLRMAVWLRVKNGEGETVDLVPASLYDDNKFDLGNNYQSMGQMGNQMSGGPNPVMRFTGATFTFGEASFANFSDVAVDIQPKGVLCPDPRWNWAPEHWYKDDNASKAQWISGNGIGSGRRDDDIFMATSDAGYLQSVYELAFLPRLTNLESSGMNEVYGNIQNPDDGRADFAATVGDVRNYTGADGVELMWRTYCPYDRNGVERDLFEFNGGGFVSEGGGVKINPYSDSSAVIEAAFANTPLDWWVASACDSVRGQKVDLQRGDAREFNKHYAFSSLDGADVKFAWGHLQEMAANFNSLAREKARNAANDKSKELFYDDYWQEAFDEVFRQESDKKFFGEVDVTVPDATNGKSTDPLMAVDRRFLYGYWRDCFAVRQQLFLVFVRAEPSMMGGGSVKEVPPALGARAVALVWRDPSYVKTKDDDQNTVVPPHRTRVLFYRQFE